MFAKLGVTAKFLAAIAVAILAIQVGSGVVSLYQSRDNLAAQADRYTGQLSLIGEDQAALLEDQLLRKEASLASVLAGIAATYVGHPLADLIPEHDQTAGARAQLRIAPERKVIALLPGSRQSELRYMADTFIATAKLLAQKIERPLFLVPLVSRETREIFEAGLRRADAAELPLTILFGHAREALAAADIALVASGTATLEAALLKKPMVITYKMAGASWLLMRRMGYLPYIGLPNILAGEFVVPELLQHDATPENLAQALHNALRDGVVRARLPQRFSAIHRQRKCDTAEQAARAVLPLLARAAA